MSDDITRPIMPVMWHYRQGTPVAHEFLPLVRTINNVKTHKKTTIYYKIYLTIIIQLVNQI